MKPTCKACGGMLFHATIGWETHLFPTPDGEALHIPENLVGETMKRQDNPDALDIICTGCGEVNTNSVKLSTDTPLYTEVK